MQQDADIPPDAELFIGAYIDEWASQEQWQFFQYMTKQIDIIAKDMLDVPVDSATMLTISHGHIAFTVMCEDPQVALKALLPTLKRCEAYIPDNYGEPPIFLYVHFDGEEPEFISDMPDDDDDEFICDDCIKAMKEEETAKANLAVKQSAVKSEPTRGL